MARAGYGSARLHRCALLARQSKVGFTAPVIIVRGRRYHRKADIEDFVGRLVEATETRAATTSAPLNPRRRSAKGRASAGGVVTG
jgi:hypothetical protein